MWDLKYPTTYMSVAVLRSVWFVFWPKHQFANKRTKKDNFKNSQNENTILAKAVDSLKKQ